MINLLPPELKESVKFARFNTVLIQYAAVAILTAAIILSLMTYGQVSLQSTKTDLESSIATDRVKLAELQQVNSEAKRLSGTINTIDRLLDDEVKFSFLIQEIGSILPPGVIVSGLTLSNETSEEISLSVLATNAEKPGVFQENLIASDLFISADILTLSSGGRGNYPIAAEMQAYYNPDFPLSQIDELFLEEEAQ